MGNTMASLWNKFTDSLLIIPDIGIKLDTSRMRYPESFIKECIPQFNDALSQLEEIERGEKVNTDEGRMVGHYWLRNPELAPDEAITSNIKASITELKNFSDEIHSASLTGQRGGKFKNVLIIGIGGSALGPQLVSDALGTTQDKIKLYFCDNTDPDGIERVKAELEDFLDVTLCIVISKSGGTVETKNGMREFEAAYQKQGLEFGHHAVAITCKDSALDAYATEQSWCKQLYMWDWVGGRTSLFSQVGLLPAALQGIDVDSFIEGARIMDEETRSSDYKKNPALILSAMWLYATDGSGSKDMVILPYKDRLVLFSKYLQQLIMESLGKELDRDGKKVFQGISVYGNKGSTDQHAYIQQLREGVPNFFATFIEVLEDYTPGTTQSYTEVAEQGVTSGAYLNGFFQGTREALYENGRDSITITLDRLDAKTLGAIIALFERAVGFYASYTNINAYHQPGVEAGKKAAEKVIAIRRKITALPPDPDTSRSPEEIAMLIGEPSSVETVYRILEHIVVNDAGRITRVGSVHPREVKYCINK
jgi:glucose-6-phosphate isomerase